MWFESWSALGRTAIASVVGFLCVVVFVRISGKRTLAKMSAFDLVVTVALGSTLATLVLSAQTPILNGLVALAALIGLQYAVAWGIVRSRAVRKLATSEPALLFYQGEFLRTTMRRERVGEDDIRAAVRAEGIASLAHVAAVVLESSGELSVTVDFGDDRTALADLTPR